MDRIIVYPGAIPLDTDILGSNRNVMAALGFLAAAVFGTETVADGLACTPTAPPSLAFQVGPGCITQLSPFETTGYGSLPADPSFSILKLGSTSSVTSFAVSPPASTGQSINYLVQAAFLEVDVKPQVLPYYNASNPTQVLNGPTNSGAAQNTVRAQTVQLQVKAGVAANSGHQTTPSPDAGWISLYQVTVAYGQAQITPANIQRVPTAPFIGWKLPALAPGFGSGVQTFNTSGTFTVPAGVSQVEVEVWGGGAGSYGSIAGLPSGGGSGGGYARKRIANVTPGQPIAVAVGAAGTAGTAAGGPAGPGGVSSFGSYVSATGGALNYLASASQPQNGATPPGFGVGGDVNFTGSAGQAGIMNQGGLGGGAPFGGTQNSGTSGNAGTSPGGGAAGAGTGANGMTPYDGAAGAAGLVVVRW